MSDRAWQVLGEDALLHSREKLEDDNRRMTWLGQPIISKEEQDLILNQLRTVFSKSYEHPLVFHASSAIRKILDDGLLRGPTWFSTHFEVSYGHFGVSVPLSRFRRGAHFRFNYDLRQSRLVDGTRTWFPSKDSVSLSADDLVVTWNTVDTLPLAKELNVPILCLTCCDMQLLDNYGKQTTNYFHHI